MVWANKLNLSLLDQKNRPTNRSSEATDLRDQVYPVHFDSTADGYDNHPAHYG